MIFSIPIFVEERSSGAARPPTFIARPLFYAEPVQRAEKLSRALTRSAMPRWGGALDRGGGPAGHTGA